ncbi:hypothetical protein OIDMADRAFT_60991 [Oidiodendron maius Zn]|uniref:Rhodopsin domain-containing protein n=1 Tax=Oidiodendron maius (strain Zn) TaxID=913774 RepID=A0A0C3CWU6_OIDMZ|nr:hypothetical protein OIDMADRAFT_60991 [Oidiodendron maius Zn]
MSPLLLPRGEEVDGIPNRYGFMTFYVNLALVLLATFLGGYRFYARFSIYNHFGVDDWLILFALLISITMTGLIYEQARNGFGLHADQVLHENYLNAMKYLMVSQILYKSALGFAKMSMLFLYLRIFTGRIFRISAYTVMFIVISSAIGTIFPNIFQCRPIEKAWNLSLPGECISMSKIWYASSACDIATDVMIILLPISQLPRLKLPKVHKVALGGLFCIGIFIIATSISRMTTLGPLIVAKDPTYYLSTVSCWMAVEVNTSIICACVPPLKSTIVRLFPRLFTSLDIKSRAQHSTPADQGFSRTVFTTSITATGKHTKDQDSDEEIMLPVMGRNEIERKDAVHVNHSRNDDVRDNSSKDDSRIESLH